MKYKIFISDFDDTLVRKDGTISKENQRAIAEYRAKGGIFVICSGRMTPAILPRAKELGLNGIVVSFQGAVVTDLESGKTLKSDAFEDERAYEVIEKLESFDYHTHIYTAEKMYCNRDDEALKEYERICRVKAEIVENLAGFARRERLKIVKMVVFVHDSERKATEEKLTACFPDCYVTCSARYLVEVMPKGMNKGEAVRFLSKHYGIPLEEIAAIGDMTNDIPLVAAAGGKFAVENAEEELKQIATVVPSCEENGVAYAIRKYAMEEKDRE